MSLLLMAARARMNHLAASANDPYWSSVVSLLHFDGANGSTVFTDEIAVNAWGVTSNPASIQVAQQKFGGASLGCLGTGYILATKNSGLDITTGDFTIECWCYPTTSPSGQALFTNAFLGAGTNVQYALAFTTQTQLGAGVGNFPCFGFFGSGVWKGVIAPSSIVNNQWTHLAVSRNGDVFSLFVNGALAASATISGPLPTTTASASLYIGRRWDAASSPIYFPGYIDEFRITKGVGRYTTNFVLATAPFPNG